MGVRGEDIRMFRIGINLEASGKGEEDGFTFKSIQILKEIFLSQVLVVFFKLILVKSVFVAYIQIVQQYPTQSTFSTSLPQIVQS